MIETSRERERKKETNLREEKKKTKRLSRRGMSLTVNRYLDEKKLHDIFLRVKKKQIYR